MQRSREGLWRRQWQPTPVRLPGEFHGQRSLVGCCPWGRTESDMTEATFPACLHWRGKWQPTPVCLPGGSHGRRSLVAAVCGVAQSQTQLKRLSSSSREGLYKIFAKSEKTIGKLFLVDI